MERRLKIKTNQLNLILCEMFVLVTAKLFHRAVIYYKLYHKLFCVLCLSNKLITDPYFEHFVPSETPYAYISMGKLTSVYEHTKHTSLWVSLTKPSDMPFQYIYLSAEMHCNGGLEWNESFCWHWTVDKLWYRFVGNYPDFMVMEKCFVSKKYSCIVRKLVGT